MVVKSEYLRRNEKTILCKIIVRRVLNLYHFLHSVRGRVNIMNVECNSDKNSIYALVINHFELIVAVILSIITINRDLSLVFEVIKFDFHKLLTIFHEKNISFSYCHSH